MAIKERNQSLTIGDTVRLRIFALNSNEYTNVVSINTVNIYYLDPTARTDINHEGKTLFATLDPTTVVNDDTGKYHIDLVLTAPLYVIGRYIDEWDITYSEQTNCNSLVKNDFEIFPNLWIISQIPLVYDFDFQFIPNRIVKDSVRYLTVEVTPIVPRALDLQRYYQNLSISSNITITIIQKCGACIPAEEDLRVVVENACMEFQDGRKGYYLLDTTEMDCGIYDVFFTLLFGNTTHISNRTQLEIFK